MQEEVYLDLLGQRRLIFSDAGVTHYTDEIYLVIPLPLVGVSYSVLTRRPIPFHEIRWIGTVRKRQTWALIMGLLFTPPWLWCIGLGATEGMWGLIAFGALWLVVMGLFPLWLYWRGRPFLVIASDRELICIPQDRNIDAINRAMAILRLFVNSDHVHWELR